jgi:hypothetical protein
MSDLEFIAKNAVDVSFTYYHDKSNMTINKEDKAFYYITYWTILYSILLIILTLGAIINKT